MTVEYRKLKAKKKKGRKSYTQPSANPSSPPGTASGGPGGAAGMDGTGSRALLRFEVFGPKALGKRPSSIHVARENRSTVIATEPTADRNEVRLTRMPDGSYVFAS